MISFGILYDWEFESQIFDKFKIPIITYDGSTGKRYFAAKIKTRIKSTFSDITYSNLKRTLFYLMLPIRFFYFFTNRRYGVNKKHYEKFVIDKTSNINKDIFTAKHGYEPKFIRFEEIIENHIMNDTGVILKIDIEENEYDLLDSILKIENNLSMLLIEFHNLNEVNFKKLANFIEKFNLQLIHTHCVNFGWTEEITKKIVSENGNPLVAELTFSSSSFATEKVTSLPNPLDVECDPNGRSLNISIN